MSCQLLVWDTRGQANVSTNWRSIDHDLCCRQAIKAQSLSTTASPSSEMWDQVLCKKQPFHIFCCLKSVWSQPSPCVLCGGSQANSQQLPGHSPARRTSQSFVSDTRLCPFYVSPACFSVDSSRKGCRDSEHNAGWVVSDLSGQCHRPLLAAVELHTQGVWVQQSGLCPGIFPELHCSCWRGNTHTLTHTHFFIGEILPGDVTMRRRAVWLDQGECFSFPYVSSKRSKFNRCLAQGSQAVLG